MAAHVITFGRGATLRFLALADVPDGSRAHGWRPVVWTADRGRAEMFGSVGAARRFGLANVPHAAWDIAVAPPGGHRGDDGPSGTSVVMAQAA